MFLQTYLAIPIRQKNEMANGSASEAISTISDLMVKGLSSSSAAACSA